MPILIVDGADPLSDAAQRSESESVVRNAQSDAGRVVKLELMRYCRGEVHGRSFLVAGHRGAGKTMMVADALDKVLRQSRRPGETMLRPLPIFLHGPSLFEVEAPEQGSAAPAAAKRRPRRDDTPPVADLQAQARVALKQFILGLHRAVAKEFVRAYRQRLVEGPGLLQPSPLAREDLAELAAQFEIELTEDPSAARLHEFWDMAGARTQGVLFDMPVRPDQGARELVAVNGLCNAHQRISGEISAQDKTARREDATTETQAGLDLRGAELARPLVSVLAGAAVAGGAAAGAHHLGLALVSGLATAIGSAALFKASSTTTRHAGRQLDTTFIPDLSLKTLDRILPTLIQRLRDCGLAPVLIVDELDKVSDLAERFIPMMDFMKKLVAENIFSCFITDRAYLETLRMRNQDTAYGRASSYFTHSLLVTYRPADVDVYLDKLLVVDRTSAPPLPEGVAPADAYQAALHDAEADVVDLEVLKWVLRHRSRLHALGLAREIAALRGEASTLSIAPGAVRTEYTYRIDVTFQVAIEFLLAQPYVQAWLRQRPGMSQTLLDSLYFPSLEWLSGRRGISQDSKTAFEAKLVSRMNLAEVHAPGASVSFSNALSEDDKEFLWLMVMELLRFLHELRDVRSAGELWSKLPPRAWSPRAEPTLAVLQAMLLSSEALVLRDSSTKTFAYAWRYTPTGEARLAPGVDPLSPNPVFVGVGESTMTNLNSVRNSVKADQPQNIVGPKVEAALERIIAIETNLWRIFKWSDNVSAPDGAAFKLLGDRLRILPTTPAWSRVNAAVTNIKDVLSGGGSRGTLLEDERAVTDFLNLLDESASMVIHALVVASFCGAARANAAPAEAFMFALEMLSAGESFGGLNSEELLWSMERMETSARDDHGADLVELAKRAEEWHLDDPRLPVEVRNAASLGGSTLASLSWPIAIVAAWNSLEERLRGFALTGDSPPAALDEILCAIRGVGPYVLVDLDLKAMPLQRWTRAFVGASMLGVEDPGLKDKAPRWLVGHALHHLGAATLDTQRVASLIAWALGPKADPIDRRAVEEAIFARSRGGGALEVVNRVAICITAGVEAPMGGWTAPPQTGFVLVIRPELLPPILAMSNAVLRIPFVVATAQGPGVRISPEQVRGAMSAQTGNRQIWVYRQRYSQMLEPAVVGPQKVDEVLDYAPAPPPPNISSVAPG